MRVNGTFNQNKGDMGKKKHEIADNRLIARDFCCKGENNDRI